MKVAKIILAVLLPPLAAFMQVGVSAQFWLNIVLSLFFWVPGIIHALWLVLSDRK